MGPFLIQPRRGVICHAGSADDKSSSASPAEAGISLPAPLPSPTPGKERSKQGMPAPLQAPFRCFFRQCQRLKFTQQMISQPSPPSSCVLFLEHHHRHFIGSAMCRSNHNGSASNFLDLLQTVSVHFLLPSCALLLISVISHLL